MRRWYMDNIITTLLSWQFISFGLAISAILFVLKTVIEFWKTIREAKLWKEVFLPILPVIIGSAGAVVLSSYPYPENITTVSARLVFGLIAGLFSGLIYRIIKALIIQKVSNTVTISDEEK